MSRTVVTVVMVGALLISSLFASQLHAVSSKKALCEGSGGNWNGSSCANVDAKGRTVEGFFADATTILLFLISAIAVIMIVIAGIRFTTSGGDQAVVKSAKSTILYAVVGILIAFVAYATVQFLLISLSVVQLPVFHIL